MDCASSQSLSDFELVDFIEDWIDQCGDQHKFPKPTLKKNCSDCSIANSQSKLGKSCLNCSTGSRWFNSDQSNTGNAANLNAGEIKTSCQQFNNTVKEMASQSLDHYDNAHSDFASYFVFEIISTTFSEFFLKEFYCGSCAASKLAEQQKNIDQLKRELQLVMQNLTNAEYNIHIDYLFNSMLL
ncbi:hypothetical protein GJ496_001171 [Pomphorhynchus laevis]|nr:hypothetical protein GJ496_001171 [Pomphorhynchus laevis]